MRNFALTTAAATLLATTASAQIFGSGYGTDLDRDNFVAGMDETGYYDVLDRNEDSMLDRSEYSTGLYREFDRDRDLRITSDEFEMGSTRYFADQEYDASLFDSYDADRSGYLEQEEFGQYYGTEFNDRYTTMDMDADGMLNRDEYNTGMYDAADINRDQVISIEEEGFFEGWFDGDDVEAEIESVGDVYTDI